jgi:acetylornithine/N-succinyldiaminopimelate aminotransferase
VKGEGSWLTAEDGSRYLDLGCRHRGERSWVTRTPSNWWPALTEQAAQALACVECLPHPEQEKLAEMLVDNTFADTVFFTNSGTETAELAIKMARKYHYEKASPSGPRSSTFEGAFHGRSTGAIAAAGSEKMVKGFGPLMPGFTHLPWATTRR